MQTPDEAEEYGTPSGAQLEQSVVQYPLPALRGEGRS